MATAATPARPRNPAAASSWSVVMTGLTDPRRTIGNMIQFGTVESVDRAQATCRARIGDIVTGDIPWLAARAGATRTWSAPSVGEQLVILAPEGDLEGAVALPGLYSNQHPAPAADAATLIDFKDGALIGYDPEAHTLSAALPAGARVTIVAPGGLEFTGDLAVEGEIRATGKIVSDDDVVGGGKSLKGHKHLGVTAGGGVSGPPQ